MDRFNGDEIIWNCTVGQSWSGRIGVVVNDDDGEV